MSEELHDLEFRIAKLALAPDDVLVVRIDRVATTETFHRVGEYVRAALDDNDRRILVIDGQCDLSILTRADIEARALGPSPAASDEGADPATTDLFKPTGNDGVVNAEICFNSLLLVCDTDIAHDLVASWTQDQMDRAYDWAMRLHLHASDNPGVFVPQRPDFIPKFARPVGIDGWTPRT